jgi:hypothetical protein
MLIQLFEEIMRIRTPWRLRWTIPLLQRGTMVQHKWGMFHKGALKDTVIILQR